MIILITLITLMIIIIITSQREAVYHTYIKTICHHGQKQTCLSQCITVSYEYIDSGRTNQFV